MQHPRNEQAGDTHTVTRAGVRYVPLRRCRQRLYMLLNGSQGNGQQLRPSICPQPLQRQLWALQQGAALQHPPHGCLSSLLPLKILQAPCSDSCPWFGSQGWHGGLRPSSDGGPRPPPVPPALDLTCTAAGVSSGE